MSISKNADPTNQINSEDIPRLLASLAIYGAAIGYGGCLAVLGPSLPELSQSLMIEVVEAGQIFTWRGVGGLFGTFLAASLLNSEYNLAPKHVIVTIFIILSSITTFIIPFIVSFGNGTGHVFNIVKGLFLIQGMGFGAMDILCIVGMQEMWGQRVKPFMQIKNLMSSSGAVLAPVLVSYFGFFPAFKIVSLTGFTSLVGIALGFLYSYKNREVNFNDDHVAPELENLACNLESIQEELDNDGSILGSIDMGTVVSGSEFQEYSRVLSFATPQIVELLEKPVAQIFDVHIVPRHVSLTIAMFTFIHVGLLFTYGGWIATYTLMVDPGISFSDAAKMSTFYSICVFAGAVYAIPASLIVSTTSLLRFQLTILLFGALTLFIPLDPATLNAVSAVLMGFAVSCIYPLIMTLANDYGFTMDSRSVINLVIGGGIGESIVPAAVGMLVAVFGANSFPVAVTSSVFVMILAYFYVHFALTHYQEQLVNPVNEYAEGSRLNRSLTIEDEFARPRSRSRLTRGWRSMSVDKYTGSEALVMITEESNTEKDITIGTNHIAYQSFM